MTWQTYYERWDTFKRLDENLKETLDKVGDQPLQLEDFFYKHLEFGTGGMRGELGPGINRLNIYTIRRAAEGLSLFINEQGDEAKSRGLVIAYDSRHQSPEFALEVAKTAGKHGINVYLFDELKPTPLLSFAVRHLNAFSGVVITASHNPSEYNGFKVYDESGGQIPPEAADKIIQYINGVENELEVKTANEGELLESGKLKYIGEDIDLEYTDLLKSLCINPKMIQQVTKNIKIVFTPLHGTGNKPVRDGLKTFGFENVIVVKEQELPDANFSTVKSPNPEEHSAFELAIKYGTSVDADILMATDPDADRLGIAVKCKNGDYQVLTGNQIGALMLEYLLSQKSENGTLPKNGAVIKTIVTSEIGRAIANLYGIETFDTLTGFKFIGEKIADFEQKNSNKFLFGYEESYGYLIGDFVRDKDAVQAAVFAAEVSAFYKSKGMTLYEGLISIFEKYGFYNESLETITLKGKDGAEQISHLMDFLRNNPFKEIAGSLIVSTEDYLTSIKLENGENHKINLPKSNVIKYFLDDGSWFCVRPSGTEPKAKFYFSVIGDSLDDSRDKTSKLQAAVMDEIRKILG